MSWIRRETEKETVQYICPHCHDYHEFREDFGERTFSENYIFCRRCGARNGTGNAPTLTQPNEPLTLEVLAKSQLLQMLGEKVEVIRMGEMCQAEWATVRSFGDCKTDSGCLCCHELYGKTWLAYRRPPEGEEK